eukprot:12191324-Alexandrium_andersonii.AAC.1
MGCPWRNATFARRLGLPPAQRWESNPPVGMGLPPAQRWESPHGHGLACGETPHAPLGKVAPAP